MKPAGKASIRCWREGGATPHSGDDAGRTIHSPRKTDIVVRILIKILKPGLFLLTQGTTFHQYCQAQQQENPEQYIKARKGIGVGSKLGHFPVAQDRGHEGLDLEGPVFMKIVAEPIEPVAVKTEVIPGYQRRDQAQQPPSRATIE